MSRHSRWRSVPLLLDSPLPRLHGQSVLLRSLIFLTGRHLLLHVLRVPMLLDYTMILSIFLDETNAYSFPPGKPCRSNVSVLLSKRWAGGWRCCGGSHRPITSHALLSPECGPSYNGWVPVPAPFRQSMFQQVAASMPTLSPNNSRFRDTDVKNSLSTGGNLRVEGRSSTFSHRPQMHQSVLICGETTSTDSPSSLSMINDRPRTSTRYASFPRER